MHVSAEYFFWAAKFVITPDDFSAHSRVILLPKEGGGAYVYALNGQRAAIFEDARADVGWCHCVLPVKPLVAACKIDKKRPGKVLRFLGDRWQVDQGNAAHPFYIETDLSAVDPGGLVPLLYPAGMLAHLEKVFSTPQSREWIGLAPHDFTLFDFEGQAIVVHFASDGTTMKITSPYLPGFTGVVMPFALTGEKLKEFSPEDF